MMGRIGALLALTLLGGCALFGGHEHALMLETAVKDDQACVSQGWKYPEPRYVSCRLKLQDDRLHNDWLNLQLMKQTQSQYQPNNVPLPNNPHDVYRPLNPDYFNCRYVTEAGQDYVLCDEADSPKP